MTSGPVQPPGEEPQGGRLEHGLAMPSSCFVMANREVRRQERVAAKYAYIWLRKTFPDGTEHQRLRSESTACPVASILLQDDNGDVEMLHPENLRKLCSGERVMSDEEATFMAVHPGFPDDAWYLPGQGRYWSNNLDEHMVIRFIKPTRVFVLLASLSQEPRWLSDQFHKFRDPNYVQIQLRVSWKLSLSSKLTMLLTGQLREARQQKLRVFRAKSVMLPGEEMRLGGPGLANLNDLPYLVAFKEEKLSNAEMIQQSLAASTGLQVARLNNFNIGRNMPFNIWFSTFVKAVKRNRLAEVRLMLETDLMRPKAVSHLATHDISLAPMEEKEQMLIDVPAGRQHLKMTCLLLDRAACELTYKALKLIVHNWEDVPEAYGFAAGLLITYLRRRGRPLSTVAAILMAMRAEIAQRAGRKPTAALEDALASFSDLQARLMYQYAEAVRLDSTALDPGERMDLLMALLDAAPEAAPAAAPVAKSAVCGSGMGRTKSAVDKLVLGRPMLLHQFRPLRVAFMDKEYAFTAVPLVEGYTRLVWCGREFVQETSKDNTQAMSVLNPTFVFVMLCNLGFANKGAVLLALGMRWWHYCTFSSQAFFNSPRARWLLHLLCNVWFLIIYLQVIHVILPSWWGVPVDVADHFQHSKLNTITVTLFNFFILGNLVETLQFILLRYKTDAFRFLAQEKTTLLFIVVDVFMLVLGVFWVLYINQVIEIDTLTITQLMMAWGSMAPLLWGRCLLVMIPLIQPLGPMLGTMKAMMLEVATFAVPWLVITVGFAISLDVVLAAAGDLAKMSFWEVLLFLFQGFVGDLDWGVVEQIRDSDLPEDMAQALAAYVIVVLVAYSVLCILLLGNLLIAIMTNRYRPEQAKSASIFNFAMATDRYQFQVDAHLLCSPLNVVCFLFSWLPTDRRVKLHPSTFWRWGVTFLDGFTPATPYHVWLPCGHEELPHLFFLTCINPLVWACSMMLFWVHLPFCAVYFATTGRKAAIKQMSALLSSSRRWHSFAVRQGGEAQEAAGGAAGAEGSGALGKRLGADTPLSSRSVRSFASGSDPMASGTFMDVEEIAGLGEQMLGNEVPAPQTRSAALRNAATELLVFPIFACAGLVAYVGFGLVVVVFAPTLWWLAALLWSAWHVMRPLLRKLGQRARRLLSQVLSHVLSHHLRV